MKYLGKQESDKDIATKEYVDNSIPVTSVNGKTGDVTITASDVAAIPSTAGAVSTTNLGDGIVTRAKFADDAKVPPSWAVNSNYAFLNVGPFNGGIVYADTSANDVVFTCSFAELNALPADFSITIVKYMYAGTFTFSWLNDMNVINAMQEDWIAAAGGSIQLVNVGDMITITKRGTEALLYVDGNLNVSRKHTLFFNAGILPGIHCTNPNTGASMYVGPESTGSTWHGIHSYTTGKWIIGVLDGKLYVNQQEYHVIHEGTSAPDSSLGDDGDIYVKYST